MACQLLRFLPLRPSQLAHCAGFRVYELDRQEPVAFPLGSQLDAHLVDLSECLGLIVGGVQLRHLQGTLGVTFNATQRRELATSR